jgi:Holliday junction resolvasome RuvABC endonuclease subunit
MKRWWRLTSTKKSIPKNTGNAAADAAAVAIAHMLRDAKKLA